MKEGLRDKNIHMCGTVNTYLKQPDICWWNTIYVKQSALRQTKKLWSDKDQAFCDLNAERLEAFKH